MGKLDDSGVIAGAAIVVDRRGYIVGWNGGAEIVLGHPASDVVGRASHHVLCGRKLDGELVCHPWCKLSPATRHDTWDDVLVLYPRTAAREAMCIVLDSFHVGVDDPMRGWVVHVITSAEVVRTRPSPISAADFAWSLRRHASKPKPPETGKS